jgi:hypothetical protein
VKLLSKSKYLSGLQCHKLLWYQFYAKDSFPPVSESTQAVFDQGNEIGKLAHSLFPGGFEIVKEYTNIPGALAETHDMLKARIPLFEAAFKFDSAYARVDILNPVGENEWDIIEVKSSTSVKPVHHEDLAVQKYILQGCGLKIRKCVLMHIDNTYVRTGAIDPKKLFFLSDETEAINRLLPEVKKKLDEMQEMLMLKIVPDINIGSHCSHPYDCALQAVCWKFLPEKNNVFALYRGGKKATELVDKGIHDLKKIPGDFPLTEKQKIQLDCIQKEKIHIDAEEIKTFISNLKPPFYFLDFETFTSAIPPYDKTRPYQQIPFQFSVFSCKELFGEVNGFAYLADSANDPRPQLLENLKRALGTEGHIICYNAGFEKARIREMAADFPEYTEWAIQIENRIVDLLTPFQSFHYYHPDQEGSASFKAVLPALTGKSYSGLEIAEGGTASREFMRITFTQVSDEEKTKVRTRLIDYCNQDTEGMLFVLRKLKEISS